MAREYTNKLYDMIDQGLVDWEQVAKSCLTWMSEDDVRSMMESEEYILDEEEEEEEEEEDYGTKYAFTNGNRGYMPDYNSGYFYDSPEEAAGDAQRSLELTDEETEELIRDRVLYLDGDRVHEVGADVVEIHETDDPDEIRDSME